MISFELSDEVKTIQDVVHKFAESEIRPLYRECEKEGAVRESLLKKYQELGMALVDIPEAQAGAGLGLSAAAVVAEELAWGDPGVAVGLPGPGLAGAVILAFGSDAQKGRLLPRFAEPAAFAARGAVNILDVAAADLENLKLTAPKTGAGYSLSGEARFVIHAGQAELYLLLAKEQGSSGLEGLKAFSVERGAAGLSFGPRREMLGLRTVACADLQLAQVEVKAADVLSPSDPESALAELLARVRLQSAAWTLGAARAALEYAVRYSTERVAFGKPIGHFQALAFMMADMATEVDSARWLLWRAANDLDHGRPRARKAAAMAAAQAFQVSHNATSNAVQILGGHGYIQDHPVEKWMRDSRTLSVIFGEMEDVIAGHAQDLARGVE